MSPFSQPLTVTMVPVSMINSSTFLCVVFALVLLCHDVALPWLFGVYTCLVVVDDAWVLLVLWDGYKELYVKGESTKVWITQK